MDDDRHAVAAQADVELQRIGALVDRQLKGFEGVLGRVGRGATVGDDRARPWIQQNRHVNWS